MTYYMVHSFEDGSVEKTKLKRHAVVKEDKRNYTIRDESLHKCKKDGWVANISIIQGKEVVAFRKLQDPVRVNKGNYLNIVWTLDVVDGRRNVRID